MENETAAWQEAVVLQLLQNICQLNKSEQLHTYKFNSNTCNLNLKISKLALLLKFNGLERAL